MWRFRISRGHTRTSVWKINIKKKKQAKQEKQGRKVLGHLTGFLLSHGSPHFISLLQYNISTITQTLQLLSWAAVEVVFSRDTLLAVKDNPRWHPCTCICSTCPLPSATSAADLGPNVAWMHHFSLLLLYVRMVYMKVSVYGEDTGMLASVCVVKWVGTEWASALCQL